MTLKCGENTMIQGLNTNNAISLSLIWLPSFVFCLFVFFIDTSMAVAEEHSSLFNEDNREKCGNSGSPCGSIEDIWEKRLLSDSQLSLLSSSSATAMILNFLFDFFHVFCICGTTTTINIPFEFFRVWRLIFIMNKIHQCQQILNESHPILYNILFSKNHWTTLQWSCIININTTLNR